MDDMNKFVDNSSFKFWVKAIIGIVFVLVLCGISTTYVDVSKKSFRDEGLFVVETLYSDGEITAIGESHVYANGRRRRRQHNLHFYINEIQDTSGTRVPTEELDNYTVGDQVVIMREVYYLKPGFRMFYKDSVVEIKEG